MIFEFFKKLFWRADESSRKRKSYEWHDNESGTLSKKSCQNLLSNVLPGNNEITNTDIDKFNIPPEFNCFSSLRAENYESNNGRKSELFEKLPQMSFLINDRNSNKNNDNMSNKSFQPSEHSCSLTNFTLYKACQLIDHHKYRRMLLNFVNPCAENYQLHPKDNENSQKLEISGDHTEYLSVNNSIEHMLDLRNESKNLLYHNQVLLETKHRNFVTKNENILRDSKCDFNSFRDTSTCLISENILATNTLKEQFAAKEVMKHNFITQLTEKYNSSLEQRRKEAEEIKKMTHILAKHNRLTREAALQDHLNRSMRLCEVIFDETDSLEVKLPQLDSNMIKKIESALSFGPENEILVQEFGLRITRKDIQTLAGLNWLNDEVINFYMNLLIKRSECGKYPSIYAMNTFFYPKLLSGGHISLKRWTRKIDIFSKDLIIVPIHLGIHWCVSIIDFRNKTIQYYDSMGSPNHKCLQVLKQYLQDESIDKRKKSFEFLGWNFECIKNIPQQMNGSDCGVFSCMFAEYICANKKFDFSQEDMPYFRKKMVYEILTVQLL